MKIYTLLKIEEKTDILGCWEKHLIGYSIVFGYSATGAIFLRNPESKEYLVLYPSMPGNNSKAYGSFASTKEFEEEILKSEEFPSYGLYPIELEELPILEKNLGPCEEDQVYYPILDPALGGSGELEDFDKGNVWVRTDIVGQNIGL